MRWANPTGYIILLVVTVGLGVLVGSALLREEERSAVLLAPHMAREGPVGRSGSSATLIDGAWGEPRACVVGRDTCRLVVALDTTGVDQVKFEVTWSLLAGKVFALYDDGTHGDQEAGDRRYTSDQLIDFLKKERGLRDHGSVSIGEGILRVRYQDGDTTRVETDLGVQIPYLKEELFTGLDFAVDTLSDSAQVAKRVLNIVTDPSARFPDYEQVDAQRAAKRYYQVLPDDRDVLVVQGLFNYPRSAIPASSARTSNSVKGIGLDQFDRSSSWGSDGELEQVIRAQRSIINTATLDHELAHRWFNHLGGNLDLGNSHWGMIERPSTGLGGNYTYNGVFEHLGRLGDTAYVAWNDYGRFEQPDTLTGRYNDLERYLAGAIPISEVDWPVRTLINPSEVRTLSRDDSFAVQFEAGGIREVTKSDFIAAFGRREPRSTAADRTIRIGTIVVSDRLLSPGELGYFEYVMKHYTNLRDHTGGALSTTRTLPTGGRPTAIDQSEEEGPTEVMLHANRPNPFNPTTTISYFLPDRREVRLTVFDVLGRRVRVLVDRTQTRGRYERTFRARGLPSGVYVYRLRAGDAVARRTMTLAK